MKKRACIPMVMIVAATLAHCAYAQERSEKDEILMVVRKFFESMSLRDVDMAREILRADGQYYGVREDSGKVTVARRLHSEYIERLADIEDEYTERIWRPTVMVHGRIAVVWAQYDFHINGEFAHCGVDAFTLIKTEDGWEIAGAVYTIEPEGCDKSPLGPIEPGR